MKTWWRLLPVALLAGCNVSGSVRALYYYGTAQEYYERGDYDRAIAYYDTTLTLFNRVFSSSVYHERGLAYAAKGEYARAIADYDSALAILDEFPLALESRGVAYLRLGQPERAVADFDRTLALEPGRVTARHQRAHAWEARDSLDRAIADLDTVVVRWKSHAFIFAERGRWLARAGRLELARANYERALALANEDEVEEIRAALWRLRRGGS